MKIAVLKETEVEEKRIAVTPDIVKKYIENGFKVGIEKGAGKDAGISDEEFIKAGAEISSIPLEVLGDADILIRVKSKESNTIDISQYLRPETIIISLLDPYNNREVLTKYQTNNFTSFALELIPRITRAQSMDVLSSQSNLAGYRAVIEAVYELEKVVPMLMTAAGTVSPAKFLIIGAGVAGLQAIATAKRLGGVVSAFDVRKAAKEQVESLGARFIEVDDIASGEAESGYAKEMNEEYKRKQSELIARTIKESDVVITTALVPGGKKAPILVTKEMVESMKSGSIVVDLAAISGGNCSETIPGQIHTFKGVKIIGYQDIVSKVTRDASRLFAKNIFNFISLLYNKSDKTLEIDLEDEIIRESLVTYKGKLMKSNFLGEKNV
jgi:NAD(P) transhydrogenase subunit alpha